VGLRFHRPEDFVIIEVPGSGRTRIVMREPLAETGYEPTVWGSLPVPPSL
jgi:hypothetical protein